MRNRTVGVLLAAAMGSVACGNARTTAVAGDAGGGSTAGWNPGRSQAPGNQPPDGGELTTASISGQVTLLGSVGNSGAQVTILEPGMSPVETVTDSNGSYYLDALQPGDFTATFSAAGYQTQRLTGQLLAGDAAQVSATLERSLLLRAMAALPDGGVFLGYATWVQLADGGRGTGNQMFYLDPSIFVSLTLGGDAGEQPATSSVLSSDGGFRFLGFDLEGGGVAEQIDKRGVFEVDFADRGTLSAIPLDAGAFRVVLMGDAIFYATAAAAPATPDSPASNGQSDWSSYTRGDLAPTPLEQDLSNRSPPAVLNEQMAGWIVGDAGNDTPVFFAPELSIPLDEVCTDATPPLQASVDGDRLAFVIYPKADPATLSGSQPEPGPCTPSAMTLVFLAGSQVIQIADDSFDDSPTVVYPLTDRAYAGEVTNADGSSQLLVHEATMDTWKSDWEGVVEGWVPLHGSSLLVAEQVDGGLALAILGPDAGGSGASGAWEPSEAIPFAHEWSAPVAFSPDNRYAVLGGVASLFDLEQLIEIPLTLTPVSAQFNRSETTAFLVDANGQMATVSLGGPPSQIPQGTLLEGVAIAASFTPDEDAVVYLGTDPMGNTGLFVQPVP